MKVLMVGVDNTSLGGMLTVVENYLNNKEFCRATNLLYIPVTTHAPIFKKTLFSFRAVLNIIRVLQKGETDIVHVHMSDGGSAFREGAILKIAKRYGCKTVAHMHAADYEGWYNKQPKLIKTLASRLLKNADIILALGEQWRNLYKRITNDDVQVDVLYNAVKLPDKNYYNSSSKNVLFLAHMIKRKGIDDLLDAIVLVKDEIPNDIRFILYGADREDNIEQRIKSRNLQKYVFYKGWLTSRDKEECLKDVLVNVLPSYHEGLPMTILETMAYGIPNISTNIAAIPEAISTGENGILINPGDVNGLADAIKKIINDQRARILYSKMAYKTVEQKFSLETHMKKILDIYRELISRK